MGGIYQSIIMNAKSKTELKSKYQSVVAHCQYMDGNGGYTGTFAEKPKLTTIPTTSGRATWTKEEAREDCLDNNDKWGAAYAYYLGNDRWYVGGWCSS